MKKKLNLGINLSANEQKGILGAGSCSSGACSVYDESTQITYTGNCGWNWLGSGYGICECVTTLGTYTPSSGTSHCWIA